EATTTTQTLVTISFISNGGTQVSSVEALPGTFISSPVDPVKDGYEFNGWYIDETLTNPYVFSEMPDENIVLYASWEEIMSSTDILTTTLIDYGFICTVNECSLEISTGYTYIYDKVNKLFIYEKITSDETGGYRI
ncbi:MAG: InlB B-repeat-containing protein, partial [Candidatus Izimaplasma sp.]|nr:InlB B-repeat-containing protein [Candidatus Izimaplasma bacterium]